MRACARALPPDEIAVRGGHAARAGRHRLPIRRDAQRAAGTQRFDDDVHMLAGADDRVYRTGLYAFGAANTVRFHDHRDQRRWLFTTTAVVGQGRQIQQMCQCTRSGITTGRATIDACIASRHRFGIRAATVVAALTALRLRQDAVETFDQFE